MTRAALALVTPLLAACAAALPPASPPPAARPAQPGFHALTPLGVELTYDARARAYAVADHAGVYWIDGRFYRQDAGNWQTGAQLDGPWSPCTPDSLPSGLRDLR